MILFCFGVNCVLQLAVSIVKTHSLCRYEVRREKKNDLYMLYKIYKFKLGLVTKKKCHLNIALHYIAVVIHMFSFTHLWLFVQLSLIVQMEASIQLLERVLMWVIEWECTSARKFHRGLFLFGSSSQYTAYTFT